MKNIDQILEKYFAGETSISEERQLRQYFNQSDIAEHLRNYQPLFRLQQMERDVATPDFDFSFMKQSIGNQPVNKGAIVRRINYYLVRIAAVLIIGLGIWWVFQPEEKSNHLTHQAVNWVQYEEEDPEKALAETKAALKLLSEKLGKRQKNKPVDNKR